MATRKKAPAKKAPGRKAPARKAPARKAPGRKAPAKKAPAKKAPGRKAPAKKAPVKKAAAGRRGAFRRRRQPESLRVRAITPGMTVDDLGRSIEFYARGLGFVVEERWTSDRGVLRGVMMRAGTCSLGLSQDDWAKGRNRSKGVGVRVWLETAQDLDALAERIRAVGAEPDGPAVASWGSRVLSVVDPDGYQLSFTEIRSR